MERLANEPGLNAFGIGVSARLDGVVSLSGRVPTLIEKWVAVQIARRAPGVCAIVDNLHVELDPAAERDDVDLADAVVRSLEWNASVPDDRINAIVADGIVTLHGAVDWPFQRSAAEHAVRGLVGVRGIQNRIVVATRVAATELQRDVELALARHAPLLADRIKVEVIGQAVVLKGSVLLRSAADPLSIDLATSDERITLLDAEGHVRTRIEDPRWVASRSGTT
jgi:osmotically-inducible protein OsmY